MPSIQFVLRPFREARCLTQRQLARRIRVAYPTVSNWESGKSHRLDFLTLGRLCTVLGVEVGDLLQRNNAKGRVGRKSKPEHKTKLRALPGACEVQVERLLNTPPAVLKRMSAARRAIRQSMLKWNEVALKPARAAVQAAERGDSWAAGVHGLGAGIAIGLSASNLDALNALVVSRRVGKEGGRPLETSNEKLLEALAGINPKLSRARRAQLVKRATGSSIGAQQISKRLGGIERRARQA